MKITLYHVHRTHFQAHSLLHKCSYYSATAAIVKSSCQAWRDVKCCLRKILPLTNKIKAIGFSNLEDMLVNNLLYVEIYDTVAQEEQFGIVL